MPDDPPFYDTPVRILQCFLFVVALGGGFIFGHAGRECSWSFDPSYGVAEILLIIAFAFLYVFVFLVTGTAIAYFVVKSMGTRTRRQRFFVRVSCAAAVLLSVASGIGTAVPGGPCPFP